MNMSSFVRLLWVPGSVPRELIPAGTYFPSHPKSSYAIDAEYEISKNMAPLRSTERIAVVK
jgi:hypothetical protein